MNCREFKQAIDTYLEGELNEGDSAEFELHLRACQPCRMELMSFDKCIKLMRNFMKDVNPPGNIRKGLFEKLGCGDMKKMCCSPPKARQ